MRGCQTQGRAHTHTYPGLLQVRLQNMHPTNHYLYEAVQVNGDCTVVVPNTFLTWSLIPCRCDPVTLPQRQGFVAYDIPRRTGRFGTFQRKPRPVLWLKHVGAIFLKLKTEACRSILCAFHPVIFRPSRPVASHETALVNCLYRCEVAVGIRCVSCGFPWTSILRVTDQQNPVAL